MKRDARVSIERKCKYFFGRFGRRSLTDAVIGMYHLNERRRQCPILERL